jgi:transcription antitermination factor NusG
MKCWYAVYVKSRTEKKVAQLLGERGIEAYVPLVRTLRQWSDRKKFVEAVLLNGYVFVCIPPAQYDAVLQTSGVVSYVRAEGKAAVIRESEITRLKQLVELGYHLEARPLDAGLRAGDRVRINSGVFRNIEGHVRAGADGREVHVLLESIGYSVIVKVPEQLLTPVTA